MRGESHVEQDPIVQHDRAPDTPHEWPKERVGNLIAELVHDLVAARAPHELGDGGL